MTQLESSGASFFSTRPARADPLRQFRKHHAALSLGSSPGRKVSEARLSGVEFAAFESRPANGHPSHPRFSVSSAAMIGGQPNTAAFAPTSGTANANGSERGENRQGAGFEEGKESRCGAAPHPNANHSGPTKRKRRRMLSRKARARLSRATIAPPPPAASPSGVRSIRNPNVVSMADGMTAEQRFSKATPITSTASAHRGGRCYRVSAFETAAWTPRKALPTALNLGENAITASDPRADRRPD
jgi:hypothetical protein